MFLHKPKIHLLFKKDLSIFRVYLLFKLTIITYQFMKFKPFLYVSLVHFVILESLFPSQDTFLLVISNSLGDHSLKNRK